MRRIKILIVLSIILAVNSITAWERTYGGINNDGASDIIPAIDGGYIVAGETESYGFGSDGIPDIYLFKIDNNGNMVWSKTYGYSGKEDRGMKIIALADGYLLAGSMGSPIIGTTDFFLMKINVEGDSEWVKYYGGNQNEGLNDIIAATDGGYLMVGNTHSWGAGSYGDAYIVRTDSVCDTIWTKRIGTPAKLEDAECAIETADGGFIISITEWELGFSYEDLILLKLNSSGDSVWVKKYAGPYHDWGNRIIRTPDGNYIISGAYGTGASFLEFAWWIIKLNDSGDTLWSKTYSMWAASKGEDIRFLPDSGFVAINSIMLTLSSSSNICVSRLNSEGDTLWNSYFGGADNDIGKAVIPISDGGFIIAGWVSSFGAGNYDCFVAKLDSLGNSSVEEKKTIPITNEIRCFPNPFNSSVRISIDAPVGAYCNTPLQIEIYDINGKKVFAESVGATHASPASTDKACLVPTEFVWSPAPSVPSGIYLIKAKMGMNIIRKKIIFLR